MSIPSSPTSSNASGGDDADAAAAPREGADATGGDELNVEPAVTGAPPHLGAVRVGCGGSTAAAAGGDDVEAVDAAAED